MIFPVGDDQVKGGKFPFVSYLLIALNTLVFIYEIVLPTPTLESFMMSYGSIPANIVHGQELYTLLTSMFLHGGWMHLIGNMVFLWVFADNIEAVIGAGKFALFYLIGGIIAALAHAFTATYSLVPMVGASGAIAAVLGAYIIMFPGSQVKLFIIIFLRTAKVPALFFLGFWIIQQLFNGYATLSPDAAESSSVAWWAHIGGFAFGVIMGFIYRPLLKPFRQYAE